MAGLPETLDEKLCETVEEAEEFDPKQNIKVNNITKAYMYIVLLLRCVLLYN